MRGRRLIAPAALVLAAAPGCGADEEPRPVTPSSLQATAPEPASVPPPQTAEPEPDDPGVDDLELTVEEALGQTVVSRYAGPTPSRSLLRRIRRGQVGGVILFADNLGGSRSAIRRAIDRLQRAARAGGRPKVLVMVDQEGGLVKRLPGPPRTSAAAMRSPRAEGLATGRMLRSLGITVDLAPVADVAHRGTFLGSRAFGGEPGEVAREACAFAAGLRQADVAPTLKHFPGLGHARINTDDAPESVDVAAAALRRDYAPYRSCGARPGTLAMLSSAVYPDLLGPEPAVLTPATYERELPRRGAWPVTISDALDTPALAGEARPARRALTAGLDLLLYANTEEASARAHRILLADARAGRIPRARLQEAAQRVLRLKAFLHP